MSPRQAGGATQGVPVAGPSFYRAHGLGNDYLVFEGREGDGAQGWPVRPEAVRAVCHRLTGVGSDGIVVLMDAEPAPDAPFPLRMFNPDGSEFERSGNGLRILAAYLHRSGRVGQAPFQVRSGGSLIRMQVHDVTREGRFDISVEMGRARVSPDSVGLQEREPEADALPALKHPELGAVVFQPVSVGNPHAVVFGQDLSTETLHALGPFLSSHPAFARGTNVQLARVAGPGRVEIAIWERGVGPTTASGTSSCAAAVAAVRQGRLEPGPIQVIMEGGTLKVTVSPSLDVVLRGPVQEVVRGELLPGFVQMLG